MELRGRLSRYNVTSHEGTRRLVVSNGMGMGNRPTILNRGISPGHSGVAMENGAIITNGGRGHCVVLRGPHNFIAAVGSRGNEGYIGSLMGSVSTELFPINELSLGSRKLLFVAGSNRFTGGLARPSSRIGGACHIAIGNRTRRRGLVAVHRKVILSNGGALPYSYFITREGTSEAMLVFVVDRNEGHRVEHVYRTIGLRILHLGHARVTKMGLNVLPGKD